MKLKDLFEEQRIIKGDIDLPPSTTKLVRYKHNGIPIAGAKVEGFFDCSATNIRSLEGAPSWVGGDFNCYGLFIASLDGAPMHIGGDVDLYDTKIRSLQDIHKQIKYIGGNLILPNTIKSRAIGLMMIKGLKKIEIREGNRKQKQIELIINNHLAGDRDVHACQEEMLEAGLGEYAKL